MGQSLQIVAHRTSLHVGCSPKATQTLDRSASHCIPHVRWGWNRLLSLFVPFGPRRNKQGFQAFARRVGIKREPRLYWVFLKTGVGLGPLKSPPPGGPHFHMPAGGSHARSDDCHSRRVLMRLEAEGERSHNAARSISRTTLLGPSAVPSPAGFT
jgi:hypothetical protein